MKKSLKVMSAAGLSAAFVASTIVPAEASVISRVLQDDNGTVFQYNQQELEASFVAHKLNQNSDGAKLFKHYMNVIKSNPQGFVAFEDDKNGYVSYASIASAFSASKLSGETFNVNEFTESGEGTPENITTGKKVSVDENGLIIETDFTPEEKPPVKPDPSELAVESVSAINATTVTVAFNKAIDEAKAENFAIEGLTVNNIEISEDRKSVTLTVSEMALSQEYTVVVSGLTVAGEAVDSLTKSFTSPAQDQAYDVRVTAEKEVLKADGASSTLLTFELLDAEGNLITNAGRVEVSFSTTFGSLGQQRVVVQNGKATVLLTSESLTQDRTAVIQAVVVEAANKNYLGLRSDTSVVLSPNPESVVIETGALMTEAEANQADRVVVYFDKEVKVSDFVIASGDNKGKIDTDKLDVKVFSGVPNADVQKDDPAGTSHDILGLKEVTGNTKALEIILGSSTGLNAPLKDNSNVVVQFTDKRGNVDVDAQKHFKLTDGRIPALLNVKAETLRSLTVEFSEAIDEATAENPANYSIDGIPLSDTTEWGTVDIQVGEFNRATGEDKRHIVTITLGTVAGKQKYFPAGEHSLQGSNIGDWAVNTDTNNLLNTQTIDFAIAADTNEPNATVEVQSPEQYLVTFNSLLAENVAADELIELQVYDKDAKEWKAVDASFNTIVVTNIENKGVATNKYLVEVEKDWTEAYQTKSTNKNYYNDNYRLVVAKETVSSLSNGKQNSVDINLPLGGAMLTVDAQSPEIDDMVLSPDAKEGASYDVTLSEPVKLVLPGSDKAKAHNESLTPSEAQDAGLGVPTVTAQFVKKDGSLTIEGQVDSEFVDSEEKVIRVKPVGTRLEAGDWTLIVRSISDDIGNTAASETHDFTVEADEAVDTDFRVLWSRVDDNNKWTAHVESNPAVDGEFVFVKFSKPVAVTGQFKNALSTENYTINGQPLPKGSTIVANIDGYDGEDAIVDSVTIKLPAKLDADDSVINISEFIESATGEKLANPGEKKLPYNTGLDANATASVTTEEEFIKAANDPAIRTIKLSKALVLTDDVTINRLVDINLNDFDVTGGVITFNTTEGGVANLTTTTSANIGDVTVNTPNADVVLGAGVTANKVVIKDINSKTFINKGTIEELEITDTNGAGFKNEDNGEVNKPININTTGAVNLGGNIDDVELTKAAKVTVLEEAAITNLTVKAAGAEITVAPDATVTNVTTTLTGDQAKTIKLVNNGTVGSATGVTQTFAPLKVDVAAEFAKTTADTATLTFTFSSNVTADVATITTTTTDDSGNVITGSTTAKKEDVHELKVEFKGLTKGNKEATTTFNVTRKEDGKDITYTVTVKYVNGRFETTVKEA